MQRPPFDRLDEFVAPDVEVNGEVQGLPAYVGGLQAVVRAFPDYRWDLRHLFVVGNWVSAHFLDTGTHQDTFLGVPATGRTVSTGVRDLPLRRGQDRRGLGDGRQPAPARPAAWDSP